MHDVWFEVDLSALKHNFRQVKSLVGDSVKIMAVVKANAYGHGYVGAAKAFVEAGADALAVTRLDEAKIIRDAGISSPVLLFAPAQPENAEEIVSNELDATICDLGLATELASAARKHGKIANVHIKVDTGMSRLGINADEAASFAKAVSALSGIKINGIYTHFATAADADISACNDQLVVFRKVLEDCQKAGVDVGTVHAANSAAAIRIPNCQFDMIRPGTILYGQYPSEHVPHILDLRPTWKLKARICQVKNLKKGSRVGYGGEFTAMKDMRVAVIPIGFADGFTLVPEGPVYRQSVVRFAAKKMRRKLMAEVNDKNVPVIGRVAMQMAAIDVSETPGVQVGDEVTVPAMRIPTNPLLPRIYLDGSS